MKPTCNIFYEKAEKRVARARRGLHYMACCLICMLLLVSCENLGKSTSSDELPPIYPDYTNITIPCNIAPLNFLLRDKPERIEVLLKGKSGNTTFMGTHKIQFSQTRWTKFLHAEQGNSVSIHISAKINGQWVKYKPFTWTIIEDKIDPYLTYRLVEPSFEAWNKIQLCERNVENFDERVFVDNNLIAMSYVNCSISANQNPQVSLFHLFGEKNAIVLNRQGRLRLIDVKNKSALTRFSYGSLHPSGKYGIFSADESASEIHTPASEEVKTFASASNLILFDFDGNRIVNIPSSDGMYNRLSFPAFSSDGNSIFYCSTPGKPLPDSIKQFKYSLLKIDFDVNQGTFGNTIDTLIYMSEKDKSLSLPKPSPDGRFILYSVSDHGISSVWHKETDLQMLNLKTRETVDMQLVNSSHPDTCHAWSSNSRWFVFAGKGDDGLYGKPYFCYVDEAGIVHKPFVLPQRDPYFYDFSLKSFNVPELLTVKLPFDAADIENLYWNGPLEQLAK